MSKKKKPKSRWVKGNERYDKKTMEWINENYREQPGFFRGAKVRRVNT